LKDPAMDTKAPTKTKQHLAHAQDGEQISKGPDAPASRAEKSSQRSIRDMVIDNNQRFAATMKSLGE